MKEDLKSKANKRTIKTSVDVIQEYSEYSTIQVEILIE